MSVDMTLARVTTLSLTREPSEQPPNTMPILKILFPDKLFFKNGHFINLSKNGISLFLEDIKEFVKEGASGQAGSADMKVLKKLGRVV